MGYSLGNELTVIRVLSRHLRFGGVADTGGEYAGGLGAMPPCSGVQGRALRPPEPENFLLHK